MFLSPKFRLLIVILFGFSATSCVSDGCVDEFGYAYDCGDYYYDDPYYDDYYDPGYCYDEVCYDDSYPDDYYDDYYYDDDYYDDDDDAGIGDDGVIEVPGEFSTIQEAVDYAISGETVFVKNGVYSPSTNGEAFPIYLKDGVNLKGEDPVNTVLDAENADYLLDVYDFDIGTVSNFTLTGGHYEYGGAIYAENSSGRLRNLYITGNRADKKGSAIYVVNSDGLDFNNLVVFENIAGDLADKPAQVEVENSNITLMNCVIANGDHDGVRLSQGADGIYENNIFFDNGATAGVGFADENATTNAHLRYNISFSNAEADYFLNGAKRSSQQLNDLASGDPIKENFSADPLFQSLSTYTLQNNSPAINAGNPATAAKDPDGTRNDIGAYGGPAANFP